MSIALPGVIEDKYERRPPIIKSLPKISDKFKGLKIAALQADDTACAYYRIVHPLLYLKAHGADVRVMYRATDISSIAHADFIILPRIYTLELLEVVHSLHWGGKTFIYEIDDNLHHVAQHNPAYTVFGAHTGNSARITQYLKICSGVLVTTKFLGKTYSNYNENIAVLDNYIDLALRDWGVDVSWTPQGECRMKLNPIPKLEGYEDKFIIGYSGGASHKEDLKAAGEGIRRAMLTHKDIYLSLAMPKTHMLEFIKNHSIPADRVIDRGVCKFHDHPNLIKGCDIQIAPISCSDFNLNKSALKIKEGMASGAAVIASCVGPYAEFHHKSGGDKFLLVGKNKYSEDSWEGAIEKLYNDREYLESLKHTGRRYIATEHSLERNHEKWAQALFTIRHRVHQEGIIGPPEKRGPTSYFKKLKDSDPCPITGEKYKKGYYGAFG